METFTHYHQMLIFEEQFYGCPIWIFVFDTDQAQIYSAARRDMTPLPALASLTTEHFANASLVLGYLVA